MVSAQAVTCRITEPARHKQEDARDLFVSGPYSDGLLGNRPAIELVGENTANLTLDVRFGLQLSGTGGLP